MKAMMQGYTGDMCPECSNFTMVQERHVPEVRHLRVDVRV
jgi:hypothetical protein